MKPKRRKSKRKKKSRSASSTASSPRRVVNLPLLLGTLAIIIIGVPALYFLRRYQVGRAAETYLEQARRLESDEDWGKAAEYIDRYLRLHPNDGVERVHLATTYERYATQAGDRVRAIELYYLALGAASEDEAATIRGRLGELLILEQRYREAAKVVSDLPESPPFAGLRHRVQAIAWFQNYATGQDASSNAQQLARIGGELETANANDPGDVQIAELLAKLYREYPELLSETHQKWSEKQCWTAADQVMDKMVDAATDQNDALLARYFFAREHLAGAAPFGDLERAIENDPDDVRALLALGASARERAVASPLRDQLLRDAVGHYQRVTELRPDLAPGHLGLGGVQLMLGDVDTALATWRRGLEQLQNSNLEIAYRIAESLISESRLEEAKEALKRVDTEFNRVRPRLDSVAANEVSQAVKLVHARYHWANLDVNETLRNLKDVITGERTKLDETGTVFAGWMLAGQVYSQLGQHERAADGFERAASLNANRPRPLLAAATAWAAAGRPAEAIAACRRAIGMPEFAQLDAPSQANAWLILARQELESELEKPVAQQSWRKYDEARKRLKAFEDRSEIATKPWRIAVLDFDAIRLRQPTKEGLQAAAEQLRGREGDFKQAVFRRQLVLIYEEAGLPLDADRALNELLATESPVSPATLGVQTQLIARRNDATPASDATADTMLLEHARQASGERKKQLQGVLVQSALASGDFKKALRFLDESTVTPDDLSVVQLRQFAEISLLAQDFKRAKQYEDQLEERLPEATGLWLDLRARRLLSELRQSENDASDPRVQQLAQLQADLQRRRPNSPTSFVMLGGLELIRGKPEAAIEAYRQAIRLGDRRVAIFEQLILLLNQTERYNEVTPLLAQLKNRQALPPRLEAIGLSVATQLGRLDQAERLAMEAVERRPEDAQGKIWLGEVLHLRGKYKEAEAMLVQATKQAPTNAAVWFSLFRHHLHIGEQEKARIALQQIAEKTQLDKFKLAITLAQGFQLMGEIESAEKHYLTARDLRPDDVQMQMRLASFYLPIRPTAAEAALRRVLRLDADNSQARQILAMLLINQGGADRWEKAFGLLDAEDISSQTASDRRLQVMLLVQRGRNNDLEQAREITEQIADEAGYSDGDRFMLARILERQAIFETDDARRKSMLKQAEDHLLNLVARSAPQYGHLEEYVGFLMRHGRARESENWLERYERRLKLDDEPTARTVARLIELSLETAAAIGRSSPDLEQWLNRLEQVDEIGTLTLKLRLRHLGATGDFANAEKLIDQYAGRIAEKAENGALDHQVEAFRSLGDVYMAIQKPSGAEKWYRRLTDIAPQYYQQLAGVMMQQDRKQEAVDLCLKMSSQLKSAGGKDPAISAAALLVAGSPSAEEFQKAKATLEEASRQREDNLDLLTALAGMHILQRQDDEAIRILRRVLKADPDHVSALNDLAVMLANNGRAAEALPLIDHAIQVGGNKASLFDSKAVVLIQLKRYQEAVKLLRRAIESPQGNSIHRLHLAVAYDKIGEAAKSRAAVTSQTQSELSNRVLTPADQEWLKQIRAGRSTNE